MTYLHSIVELYINLENLFKAKSFIALVMKSCFFYVSAGLELVLKPPRDVFNAAVGSSMVISCTLSDVEEWPNATYELHWIDHNNMEVIAKAGR